MTLATRTLIEVNSQKFWASADQAESLNVLNDTRRGGIARIYGYVAKSGRTEPTVYDATVTTRFSYEALVKRKLEATKKLTLNDVLPLLDLSNPKFKGLGTAKLEAIFNERKADEVNSLEGKGNDAQREAHHRCYAHITHGVVVHYTTEKDADGIMQPVLLDGFPMAESIMLNVLEVKRNVRVPGQYKVVNSGAPVLISNAIKAKLKADGIRSMKRVSLKEGTFERLAIDNEVVLPEDVVALAEALA